MSDAQGFGWDDAFEHESKGDFTLLKKGEVGFEVVGFERGKFRGSEKIKAGTNVAKVKVKLTDADGNSTTITEDLILWGSIMWKIAEFFISAGLHSGEGKVVPQWQKITGCKGRCDVSIREYEKAGEKKQINQVEKWLAPKQEAETAPAYGAFGS